MALVTLPSILPLTNMASRLTGGMVLSAGNTLDAAGEYEAHIISPITSMTVSHVAIRMSAATGSPTVIVRLESADASGNPSGTVLGATNNATVTSGTLTTAVTVLALGESATLVPGTNYFLKLIYNSGTSVATRLTNANVVHNLPYRVANVTGSAVKSTNPIVPWFALGSSSTSFYHLPNYWPMDAFSQSTFTNTNSAVRGNKCTMQFPCRIVGMQITGGTSLGDYNILLQDGSNNTLEGSAIDGDHNVASSNLCKIHLFDTPVVVAVGDVIRYGVEPTSATAVNYALATTFGTDYMSASPGGPNLMGSSRASGTWTDDTDGYYLMDLLVDQIDDGTGGGGGGISRARGFGGFA
jgi:hypothetical protein